MGHRDTKEDVYDAWDRYRALTGDRNSTLEKDGASWLAIGPGAPACLSRWLYGAASMVLALRAYIEGWKDARGIADESIR
jgi:hypothetical protein